MTKKIVYWAATVLLSLGMLSGGISQLARASWSAEGLVHLGYPPYLMTILGTWKVLGVIAILIPGFTLVKEWAYAGFFFVMSGATVSHLVCGDEIGKVIAPLMFLIFTVVSWYFRPAERRISTIGV